jgi:molybdate transport system substrate-binding protein
VAILVAAAAGLLGLKLWSDRRGPAAPAALRVAAAADLRYALDDLAVRFRQSHADVDVRTTYGSSGALAAQIENGAPFDLFLSADLGYPRELASKGLTVAFTEFTYASGHLVVWVRSSSPLDVGASGLQVVTDSRVQHVAMANPAHAPYGRAAEAALRAAHVYGAASPKLVVGESVAQALQFVQSGAAEVGIVALSLALSPPLKGAGRYVEVPEDLYPKIAQGGAIVRGGNTAQATAFRDFLTSPAARAVLQRYGFGPGV